MDGLRESHCPICRNPYHHFPTICEMLHFLLLKMYPVAYERRAKQILGKLASKILTGCGRHIMNVTLMLREARVTFSWA